MDQLNNSKDIIKKLDKGVSGYECYVHPVCIYRASKRRVWTF